MVGLVLADFQENEHKNEQRRLFIHVPYPLFAKLVALQVFK